jgi:hypothetical protein
MEDICNNLSTPSWWFTGLLFGVAIPIVLKRLPLMLKGLVRNRLAKWKRKVKNASFSQGMLSYEISKSNSLFLVFVIIFSLYSVWFIAGPLNDLRKESLIVFILIILPIYIFEVVWLIQDNLALAAIKRSHKLRVTS